MATIQKLVSRSGVGKWRSDAFNPTPANIVTLQKAQAFFLSPYLHHKHNNL